MDLDPLIEMEEETGNHDKAEKIAEITDHMISLFGLWNYGNTVPYLLIAGYRKDVEKCIQLIKRITEALEYDTIPFVLQV